MAHELRGKRVLVLGFARQGQALARWLPTQGAKVIVNDQQTAQQLQVRETEYPGVRFILGDHPADLAEEVDLVCVSGGVPLELPLIQAAHERGVPITNDAQLFMERCPAPVVGITGSAGKTTTTSLTAAMFANAGFTTWVGGNTGDVLLDSLGQMTAEDVVVMELSSFQLDLMTTSPTVGAVLNVTPNHIDRHGSMQSYISAKANILQHQRATDYAVLNEDDTVSKSMEVIAHGEIVNFSARTMLADGAFLAGDRLVISGNATFDGRPHVVCERKDIPLRGDHNIMNVLAACAMAGCYGLAADRPGVEAEIMTETIKSFKPVPHRLEVVREHKGITYINDSIATAPERLIAALRAFKEPLVLLIGGADKNLPWDEAIFLALQKARHIVVFGASGEKQVSDKAMHLLRLRGAKEDVVSRVADLPAAVARAYEVAEEGDVVLLSPGGTSYDAYKDFAERGEHFRRLVGEL
jgi:UDP-N-acetylmuramoylalanine--D-glutamate ligase